MIDTIHLFLASEFLPDNYLFVNCSNVVNSNTQTDMVTHNRTFFGNLNNLKIRQNIRGIYINGSLAKYYLGSNQKTLRQGDFHNAIIKLSEDLGLSLHEAKVNRIDIAENIVVNQPAHFYYSPLLKAKYFHRLENEHGIEYRNVNRSMVFYDKKQETKKSGHEELHLFKQSNILRVELRYKKHEILSKLLKLPMVTIKDVFDSYSVLIKSWNDLYHSIYKRQELLELDSSVYDIKGGFDKQVKIMGVEAMGGLSVLIKTINDAKKSGLFKNYPNEPSYLIKKFTALMATPQLTHKSQLIEDLDMKMKIATFVNQQGMDVLQD